MPRGERHSYMEASVLRIICDLTGRSVDVNTVLVDANIDSMMAIELAMRLRTLTGYDVPQRWPSSSRPHRKLQRTCFKKYTMTLTALHLLM